jgi:hypothetical protein
MMDGNQSNDCPDTCKKGVALILLILGTQRFLTIRLRNGANSLAH